MTLAPQKQKWVTVGCGFIFFFMMMGLVTNCFSLYIIPVTEDLGFTRGQFSICQTMIFAAGILNSLIAPKIYNRFGIVPVIRIAAVACGTCYFLQSMAGQLWQFYLLSFLSGFAMQISTAMPMAILIGEWFTEKKNMAIGMSALGSGVGGSLLNLICSRMIADMGWRASFRYLGIICVIVACIPAFFFLKREPQAAARDAEARKQKSESTAKEKASIRPVVYQFAALSMLINIAGCVLIYTSIPYLQDIGYSAAFAAAVSSGSMIALAFGKFLYGILVDKFGVVKCYNMSQMVAIFGLLVLIFFRSPLMLALFYISILLTCSYGSVGVPAAAEHLSKGVNTKESMGIIMAFGSVGASLSSTIAGYVFDFFGSYIPLFIAMIAAMVFSLLMGKKVLKDE